MNSYLDYYIYTFIAIEIIF